jgi:hypothetical protein
LRGEHDREKDQGGERVHGDGYANIVAIQAFRPWAIDQSRRTSLLRNNRNVSQVITYRHEFSLMMHNWKFPSE